jgi:hypothetical protein
LIAMAEPSAFAQLTITSSDYLSLVGTSGNWADTAYTSTDTSGLANIIGDSGSDRTWDLTGRNFQMSTVTDSVSYRYFPGDAPNAGDSLFSASNVVLGNGGATGKTWLFLKVSSGGVYTCGTEIPLSQGVYEIQGYEPPLLQLRFPLTFGTSWADSSSYILYTTNAGTISRTPVYESATVDGYGTVVTPFFTKPCLRLHLVSGSSAITVGSYLFVCGPGNESAEILVDANNRASTVACTVQGAGATGIRSAARPATRFRLMQNYPNPFNPSTVISYKLPESGRVTLKIYDVLGREVRTLVDRRQAEGIHSATFDARDLPSGVYFCTLRAGSFVDTKKLTFIK